jgi:Condensation domain/Phosphopantetheine attachment site
MTNFPAACGGPDEGSRTVAASYAQERVWLVSQMAHDGPLYHVADKLVIHAGISEAAMRQAFAMIVERHETLRTAFDVVDGVLMAVVHARVRSPIGFVDLSGEEEEYRAERCDAIAEGLKCVRFDLRWAPLWRATLVCLGDGDWVVPFVAHHAIFDPTSFFNLYAELTEICVSQDQGREPRLPELPFQYADYAVLQRERLAAADPGHLAGFWRSQLSGLPVEHGIPLDRPRPARRTFAGADVRTELPAEATAALPATARKCQATSFIVLLAAYIALIHRRSGRAVVVVGVPVAGRGWPELPPLIGTFVNMVVLRVDISGDSTFAELIAQVRDVAAAAREHQEMPFQRLVELFASPRRAGVPPLYQLGFNLLSACDFGSPSAAAEDDLMLEIAGGLARLEYNTALFDRRTAEGLLSDYVRVLVRGIAAPQDRLSALPVVAEAGDRGPWPGVQPVDRARPGYLAPRTESEALVATVWSDVLGVAPVGVLDSFFEMGGYSLQALRILARLSTLSGVEITLQAFFADATVAGLAAELEGLSPRRQRGPD